MNTATKIGTLATLAALAPMPTHAQQQVCAPLAAFVQFFEQERGAFPAASGVMPSGAVLQVFVNPNDLRWFVIVTDANGRTCSPAMGTDWHAAATGKPL